MDRRVIAALELIHANLHKRVSIADLARAVNMSRWRFCHVFKTEVSLSPSDYIGTLRMREAERMLGETFLSVNGGSCENASPRPTIAPLPAVSFFSSLLRVIGLSKSVDSCELVLDDRG